MQSKLLKRVRMSTERNTNKLKELAKEMSTRTLTSTKRSMNPTPVRSINCEGFATHRRNQMSCDFLTCSDQNSHIVYKSNSNSSQFLLKHHEQNIPLDCDVSEIKISTQANEQVRSHYYEESLRQKVSQLEDQLQEQIKINEINTSEKTKTKKMVKDLEDRINVLITENERLNRLVDDNHWRKKYEQLEMSYKFLQKTVLIQQRQKQLRG